MSKKRKVRSVSKRLGRIFIFGGTPSTNRSFLTAQYTRTSLQHLGIRLVLGTIEAMEAVIKTLSELEAEATRFVGGLIPLEDKATLVTLSGELGAGKTAFTKAVAHVLGVEVTVTSPTFVLEKIYQLGSETSKFKRLVHIDAYRLESGKDLAPLGFDELMQDSGNLILLEWTEKVEDVLPVAAVRISITTNTDDSRTISYA